MKKLTFTIIVLLAIFTISCNRSDAKNPQVMSKFGDDIRNNVSLTILEKTFCIEDTYSGNTGYFNMLIRTDKGFYFSTLDMYDNMEIGKTYNVVIRGYQSPESRRSIIAFQ